MIEIEEITAQNFLGIGPKQTLKLAGQGLVLIEGENRMAKKARSNGAGKSTVPEAITYVSTGETLRKFQTADGIINKRAGKDCLLEMHGNRDGKSFTITRGRRVKNKNVLDFIFNGKNLTAQGDPKETQRIIRQYLGIEYDLFTNTVIFDGQDDKFRFTRLGDAAQKALLDKLLGIEALGSALRYVKAEASTHEASIEKYTARIDSYDATLETLRGALKSQKHERLKELKEKLAKAQDEIEKFELIDEPSDKELEVAKDEEMALLAKYNKKLAEAAEAKANVKATNEKHRKLAAEADALAKRYKAARALKAGERCEECGSEIAKEALTAHAVKLHNAFSAKEVEGNDSALEIVEWQRKAEHAERDAVVLSSKVSDAQHYLEKLVRRSHQAESSKREFSELEARLADLRARIKSEKRAKSPVLAKLKERISETKRDRRDARLARKVAKRTKAHYDFWIEGFGNAGVKSHYLDYVVPLLNERARRYASQLADGITVEFSSQRQLANGQMRDRFEVEVDNAHGSDEYGGNSGGEKRKADIIVARALQSLQEDRAGTSFNIAVWDECFESLDETSSEAVMSMLQAEARTRSSIFVVSHLDWLKAHFPRVLRVVKEDGFSHLEWS